MDSASFCGDTSALTLAMSQLNSNAYRTLAMASLEQRGVEGAGTVRRRGGLRWGCGLTWRPRRSPPSGG